MSVDSLRSRARPYGTGAVAGAAAYLLGYVFTYALTSGRVRDSSLAWFLQNATGDDVTWKLVGWLFYNAQFVSTIVDVRAPFVSGTDAVNFVGQNDVFSQALYLLAPLLLVAAGLAVARRRLASDDAGDAVLTGATVAVGYLPLAVLGAVLFSVEVGSSSAAPDLLLAAVLAGVVYPVVFGAIGALIGLRTA
ncbi:MAG: hypothetical protein ABEJ31_13030 [Haloarculaceae archaeon]